jgi:hypothetical protein
LNTAEVVRTLVWIVQGYLILGIVFAVPVALFFLARLDPAARGNTWGFRIIVIPGLTLMWPLFLWRLLRNQQAPVECNAHRRLARGAAAESNDKVGVA